MKVFTKLGLSLLMLLFASGVIFAQIDIYDVDPNAQSTGITSASDDMFDLQFQWPNGVAGGEAGIETNGTYIYTTKWNGTGEFYRYDMEGNLLETITVTGAAAVRDLAYNGTYFYGAAATTTVFELDLDNATKIGQFVAPAAVRAIAYNEDDDVFYGNNWSEPVQVFSPSGASQGSFNTGPFGASYYGMAYDNYCDGTYLWAYCQPGTTPAEQNWLVQIELPSGVETGVTFSVATLITPVTGIAGGLAISNDFVPDTYTIFGNMQNEYIWGLELCASLPPVSECENFDALTVGGYVAEQLGGNWTTWSGTPGSTEDALVSDLYSISPNNSILVEGITDLVHLITGDNITEGRWSYSLNIYVPEGKTGYFNLQKNIIPGTEWGFQILFDDDMTMIVDGAAAAAAIIPYEYDTWYFCEVIVDLDNDWCEFYVDGNLEHEYQWLLGTFGTPGALTLAGSNIYAAPSTSTLTPPGAFFDDICFEELEPIIIEGPQNVIAMVENDVDVHVDWEEPNTDLVLEGYNVLRNGEQLAYVAIPATEYDDMDLAPGVYEYCVTAVYDDAVSQPVCADPVTIIDMSPPAPTMLEGMVGGNGVDLTWEGPEGGWIQWDAGTNTGNGIGVTGGGTFNAASHWEPADLEDYVGFSLTKVQFFANGDPDATYTIKVWTGVNGTNVVHTQPVASFIVDEWNEVELTTSVPINAADDFWFGYAVTHGADMYPAGCDDGPAVQYKGDMLNSGAGWVSMSAEYGLDYNWNLAGFVELADGTFAPLTPQQDITTFTNGTFVSSLESGIAPHPANKFNPASAKDLSYNVYFKPEGGAYSVAGNTAVTNYTHTAPVIGWNYYYVTTLVNGAESDPSNEVSILFTSIEDVVSYSTQVFPNPARDIVNIKSDFEIKNITVYNYAGQVITEEQVDNYIYQFNTSQFNSGIYFFQIETTDGTTSKRIIVE